MKVLVCGGRDYLDEDTVSRALDEHHAYNPISLIIHGAASGADTLADNWAQRNEIKRAPYPVLKSDWKKYGRYAGPRRNGIMLEEETPDAVIAFSGGNGTKNMCNQADKKGVEVIRVPLGYLRNA